jgi:hypothetical protein
VATLILILNVAGKGLTVLHSLQYIVRCYSTKYMLDVLSNRYELESLRAEHFDPG